MAFHSRRHLLWLLWRWLGSTALAVVLGLNPLLAHAREVGRHAALVVDANTGRILYQRSADEARYPASLVKLMTLYLIFEQIEEGRLRLDSKIPFSANAVAAPPSKLDVKEGTEIDLADAIKALITKSANDVAVAVAEHIAGSEAQFAQIMNRKARELGMKATVFRNASGLPDPEQVTTARDMITLALRLHDQFPKHYPLFATRTFTWGGDTFRNHNTLLFRYQGLDGMKTGYIRASGFNLVASARRGKKHVLAAYFGGKTSAQRNAAVRAHLDAGFRKASETKTRRPAPLVAQAKAAPVAAALAPAPARRAPPAPEVDVVRVRPVLVREAPPGLQAKPAPQAPTAIEGVLKQAEVKQEPQAEEAGSLPAAPEAPQPPTGIVALLERAEAPPAPAIVPAPRERIAPEPAAAPTGPFQIQIGAFQTASDAERQLARVRQRAGPVLGEHAAHMSQIKRGDKTFFRARYVGFVAQTAAAGVCSELKRLDIDCLVMKAE